MQTNKTYTYNGVNYNAKITTRITKRLSLRIGKTGDLLISAPYLTSMRHIDEFVERSLPSLLSKIQKRPADIDEYGYYFFGQYLARGNMSDQDIQQFLKKELLSYCSERTLYYEALMKVHPSYKVSVRSMSTRYGVNSARTHRITYTTDLAFYDRKIIDAIIVHELAHHFERNHQKRFYEIVYRYCPDYDRLHTLLRKHIHES